MDWDNLSIGNNSSFFERIHEEHEPPKSVKPHLIPQDNAENDLNAGNIKELKAKPSIKLEDNIKTRNVKQQPKVTTVFGTPKAYRYAEKYQQKRQQVILRKENEEKQLRQQFRSKSVPNFEVIHRCWRRPAKPIAPPKPVITVKPFKLNIEDRLSRRQQFDKETKTKTEERLKKAKEEKILAEERERKLARKNTQFKARPNPFK